MARSFLFLPELCITGYTCGDLFLQNALLKGAVAALKRIAEKSAGIDMLCFVGLPLALSGKLYNCAAVLHDGKILGSCPRPISPTTGNSMRSGISRARQPV
jgi:NAD+ synthase (glutamine-hydrolysing)